MILQPIAFIMSSTVIINDKIKTHNHFIHVVVYKDESKFTYYRFYKFQCAFFT